MRSAYVARERLQKTFDGLGRTKQAHAKECDINNIMARHAKTGQILHVNEATGQYGDVSGEVDYQMALETVRSAEQAFMGLPASLRARFENDAGAFLAFVENPANAEELVKLGLAERPPEPPAEKPKVEPAAKAAPPKAEQPPKVEKPPE